MGWISTLDSLIGGIGGQVLQEYFDEGLVLLKRRLQLDIKELSYIYYNAGDKHVEPTEPQRKRLSKLLTVDNALYDHFHMKFAKYWDQDKQENEELLHSLRQANSEYETFCGSNTEKGAFGFCSLWSEPGADLVPYIEDNFDECVQELYGCMPPSCA